MENIRELQELAADKSPEGRNRLAEKIVEFYITDGKEPEFLTEVEKGLLLDIVLRLVNNTKTEIKKILAENLAQEDNVPKELILTLAHSDIEVAHPVLTYSRLLGDQDLINIIHKKGPLHQFSIAGREEISTQVSDALIEAGDSAAIKKLFENNGAQISQHGMNLSVDMSAKIPGLQEFILKRPEISEDIAAKIYWYATETIKQEIAEKYKLDQQKLDRVLDKTLDIVSSNAQVRSIQGVSEEQRKIAQKLYDSGSLTSSVLVNVLKRSYWGLFLYLFHLITKLSDAQLDQIFHTLQPGTMLTICKAIGVNEKEVIALHLLVFNQRADKKYVTQAALRQIIEFYKKLNIQETRNQLKKWRTTPEQIDDIPFV